MYNICLQWIPVELDKNHAKRLLESIIKFDQISKLETKER
jgi:hypothetical protein